MFGGGHGVCSAHGATPVAARAARVPSRVVGCVPVTAARYVRPSSQQSCDLRVVWGGGGRGAEEERVVCCKYRAEHQQWRTLRRPGSRGR